MDHVARYKRAVAGRLQLTRRYEREIDRLIWCRTIINDYAPYLSIPFVRRNHRLINGREFWNTALPPDEKMALYGCHHRTKITPEMARTYPREWLSMGDPNMSVEVCNILRERFPDAKFNDIAEHRLGNYKSATYYGPLESTLPANLLEVFAVVDEPVMLAVQQYARISVANSFGMQAFFVPRFTTLENFAYFHQSNPNADIKWLATHATTNNKEDAWIYGDFGRLTFGDYMMMPASIRAIALPIRAPIEWWHAQIKRERNQSRRRRMQIRMLITNDVPLRDIVRKIALSLNNEDYAWMIVDYNQHITQCIREFSDSIARAMLTVLAVPGGLSYHEALASMQL